MDTYKRSIRGLQSRSNGEHFETDTAAGKDAAEKYNNLTTAIL